MNEMFDDRNIFTLASVADLPITSLSTLRVIKRRPNGGIEKSLFVGTFSEFKKWIHHSDEISVYTKVKSMVIGNSNANGIIVVE